MLNELKKLNLTLTIIPMILVGLGILVLWTTPPGGETFAQRQLVFLGIGLAAMFAVSSTDYRIFKNHSRVVMFFYIISIGLMLLTLFSGEIRGARAWVTIFGVRFEPSELAKLATLIVLAKYFSQRHIEIYRWPHILISGVYAGIPILIAIFQSDLGSAAVFLGLWVGMLLFAGINRRHLVALVLIGVLAGTAGWFLVLQDYQQQRLLSFLDPYEDPLGSGYSTIQSRVTLGSGQWTGNLFDDESDRQLSTLVPEPHTDFIFAVSGQRLGLIGIAVILILMFILISRIGAVGMASHNNFARLFCLGFISIIFVHVFINGGMNLGVLPITGIPFPFLSHGGSHLITLFLGLGITQSIYRLN